MTAVEAGLLQHTLFGTWQGALQTVAQTLAFQALQQEQQEQQQQSLSKYLVLGSEWEWYSHAARTQTQHRVQRLYFVPHLVNNAKNTSDFESFAQQHTTTWLSANRAMHQQLVSSQQQEQQEDDLFVDEFSSTHYHHRFPSAFEDSSSTTTATTPSHTDVALFPLWMESPPPFSGNNDDDTTSRSRFVLTDMYTQWKPYLDPFLLPSSSQGTSSTPTFTGSLSNSSKVPQGLVDSHSLNSPLS